MFVQKWDISHVFEITIHIAFDTEQSACPEQRSRFSFPSEGKLNERDCKKIPMDENVR